MKIKAILINSQNKTITEVEIEQGNIQQIYSLLNVNTFECVDIDGTNTIYCDEEFWLNETPEMNFFHYNGTHTQIGGNGLIMGTDFETGESISPTLTLDEVCENVLFYTEEQKQTMSRPQIW